MDTNLPPKVVTTLAQYLCDNTIPIEVYKSNLQKYHSDFLRTEEGRTAMKEAGLENSATPWKFVS